MEFVSSYVHLGHLITNNLDDSCDISQRRCDFIGQINNVSHYYQNLCSAVKYKLFHSVSWYGCELWDLACAKMADVSINQIFLGGLSTEVLLGPPQTVS